MEYRNVHSDRSGQSLLLQAAHIFQKFHRYQRPQPLADRHSGRHLLLLSELHSFTPSIPSAGFSINTRLIFSLPNPFGATVIFTLSPGTILCMHELPVYYLLYFHGSADLLPRIFSDIRPHNPDASPSLTASSRSPPSKCTSCPISIEIRLPFQYPGRLGSYLCPAIFQIFLKLA